MKIVLAGIVVPIILLISMLIATLVAPAATIVENIGQIYQALIAITIIPIVVLLTKATKGYIFTKDEKLKTAAEEFEKIYGKLLEIQNDELDKLRMMANIITIVDFFVAALMVLGIAFVKMDGIVISKGVDSFIKFIAAISPVALIAMIIFGVKHKRKYKKVYKEQIVTRYVSMVDKNLKYSLYGRVGDDMKNKYLVSDFETKAFNRFESEDYVDGKIDGKTYVEVVEINVDYAFKKKKKRYREDLFRGMFSVIRTEKDIGAWVKVSREKFKFFASRTRLEIDDANFEKCFDVYTDNKAVAHQLLQGEMIKTLMQFYKEYDLKFEIMFRDNIIFMRFFTKPMFEPKMFGNSMDKKMLFAYYNIVKFMGEVVEHINLTSHEARTTDEKENEKVEVAGETTLDNKEPLEEEKETAEEQPAKEEEKIAEFPEMGDLPLPNELHFEEISLIKEKKKNNGKYV